MRVLQWITTVFLSLTVANGCTRETSPRLVAPDGEGTTLGTVHPQLWTVGFAPEGERLQRIDTRTGQGTLLSLVEGTYGIGFTYGYTFDLDGSCYAMMDAYQGGNAATLCRIDMQTGAVTYVNPDLVYPMMFSGGDIDHNGVLYQAGFSVGPPEFPDSLSFTGGYSLWRVNKATGHLTEVGDTRVGTGGAWAGRWMDLAFDSQNRCWTTCDNKLFLLDTIDGHSTFVTDIIGVPQSNLPGDECPEDWQYMEVMDIAFDEHDVLWASAMRGFSWCTGFTNAPVMRIDTNTGQATVVGYAWTGVQNHGGDIMPTRVSIAHRKGNGSFQDITIAIEDLPEHLAHGDYVPGTVGDPAYPH